MINKDYLYTKIWNDLNDVVLESDSLKSIIFCLRKDFLGNAQLARWPFGFFGFLDLYFQPLGFTVSAFNQMRLNGSGN